MVSGALKLISIPRSCLSAPPQMTHATDQPLFLLPVHFTCDSVWPLLDPDEFHSTGTTAAVPRETAHATHIDHRRRTNDAIFVTKKRRQAKDWRYFYIVDTRAGFREGRSMVVRNWREKRLHADARHNKNHWRQTKSHVIIMLFLVKPWTTIQLTRRVFRPIATALTNLLSHEQK